MNLFYTSTEFAEAMYDLPKLDQKQLMDIYAFADDKVIK